MSAGNGVCNTIYADPATIFVGQGWSTFQTYAAQAYNLSVDQVNRLNSFNADFASWDSSWTGGDGTLSGFIRPTKPTLPVISTIDMTGQVPAAPTLNLPPVVLTPEPAEPANIMTPPELNLTVIPPDDLDAVRPGAAPTLEFPDAPDEPTIDTIASPTLVELDIPTAPSIDIAEFDEAAPTFDAAAPDETINFTETPYVSAFLDAVKAHMTNLMNGQAMPPEIEAALWSRALDRDEQSTQIALQEVDEEFAARGFSPEPNGMWAKRRLQVRQKNQDRRSELNRDIYVEQQKVVVENVRFAVTEGVKLEGTLLQAHLAVEQRKFELAVKGRDIAIAVFQARVSQFNAIILAYNARISAYQAFLEGQKARVEIYKAQVEGEKAKAEINQSLVAMFEAQIRAEVTKVEVYKAQVEGFRARIEAERARIEGHRSEVEAYRASVEAYKVEWDAEKIRIDAEAKRGDLYNSLVNAYATRVDIWKTKGDVRIQENRSVLATAQAQLQQHDGQVRAFLGQLEAQKALVQAQSAQGDQLVRMYQADAGVEATAVDADTRQFQAQIARENMRLEILLKDAQLQVTEYNQRSNLLLRALESAAQASSQLAASSMSAVNFSANVSSGASRNESCSTAFSYSGEIADAE